MSGNPVQSSAPIPPLPTQKKKLSGCAIAGIVGGALLALGLVFVAALWFLVGSMTADVVKASQDYLEVLKRGQTREAYEMSAAGLRKETSLAQFNKVVSQFPILSRHTAFNIKSRNLQGEVGSVTGELVDGTGKKAEIEFTLVKEQGVWRVLMVHVKMIALHLPQSSGIESRLVLDMKPYLHGAS